MTKRNKGGLGSVCQQESVQIHSVFHVNEKKCWKNQGCCFSCHKWQEIFCKFVTFTANQKQNHAAIECNVGHDQGNKKEVSRTEVWKQMYLCLMWCTKNQKITYDVVWLVVSLPSFKQSQNSSSTNLFEQWYMLSQNQSKAWRVNSGCMARSRERGNLVEMTTRPQLSKRLQISNMNDIAENFFWTSQRKEWKRKEYHNLKSASRK